MRGFSRSESEVTLVTTWVNLHWWRHTFWWHGVEAHLFWVSVAMGL